MKKRITGISKARKHSQRVGKKKKTNYPYVNKNESHIINKNENRRGFHFGTISDKAFAIIGLNQILGCSKLTFAQKGSYTGCHGKLTPNRLVGIL